jgi:cation transport ATPase
MADSDSDSERQAREQIAAAEEAEARDRATGVTSLFDLRMVIGGLLTLYGVILTVMGLFASEGSKAKAAGININLWAGLVILAGGAIFLAWARLRPLRAEDLQDTDTDRPNIE